MDLQYFDEQNFDKIKYTDNSLPKGEYEYCNFKNCVFTNADLEEVRFMETEFVDCDFSNAVITKAIFQDVKFKNCKMLGLQFDTCNAFGFAVGFNECQLDDTIFAKMNLVNSNFINCSLQGADFSEANMKKTKITGCNLLNATFDKTNLENADFKTSMNYSLDPERNRIKGATFSLPEVVGLLNKYQIQIST